MGSLQAICPMLSGCSKLEQCQYYHLPIPYLWIIHGCLRDDVDLAPFITSVCLVANVPRTNDEILMDIDMDPTGPPTAAQDFVTLTEEKGKELEKLYTDPEIGDCVLSASEGQKKLGFDFKRMKAFLLDERGRRTRLSEFFIQRLSTPSRVFFPTAINATDWIWYWQSDDPVLNWSELCYKPLSHGGMGSLEWKLIQQPPREKIDLTVQGKLGKYKFTLDLDEMVMKDDCDDFSIRRRPATFSKYVEWSYMQKTSAAGIDDTWHWVTVGELDPEGNTRFPFTSEELETRYQMKERSFEINEYTVKLAENEIWVKSKATYRSKESDICIRIRREEFTNERLIPLEKYPTMWDHMPKCRIYVTVTVPTQSEEFKFAQNLVKQSLPNHNLQRLRRIQNPATHFSYENVRKEMEALFGAGNVKEQWAFHGTNNMNIKLICEQNFDPKSKVVNGSAYGRGTYFALHASFSIYYNTSKDLGRGYSRPQPLVHKLFICKILVGRKALNGTSNDEYTTVVNSITQPEIFVCQTPHSNQPVYIAEIVGNLNIA